MGKSFKYNFDLNEESTKVYRKGNVRKKIAEIKIKERRRERIKFKKEGLREEDE